MLPVLDLKRGLALHGSPVLLPTFHRFVRFGEFQRRLAAGDDLAVNTLARAARTYRFPPG
jgi:hypothetical protein